MKRLILNYVYYCPVGHLIEAIKHARGYYEADRDLQLSLLVNSETPIELATACDWIDAVYPISANEVLASGEEAASVRAVPKDWDYVLTDPRVKHLTPGFDEEWLTTVQLVLQRAFVGKEISGITPHRSGREDEDVSTQTPLPYKLNAHIEIPLPESSQAFVKKYVTNGPIITILPAGSSGSRQSPSLSMWEEICRAFSDLFPDAKIIFTGITKGEQGRTTTGDISLENISDLVSKLPNAENCFNIGLWNQLALLEASDMFCSPHTGFAFLSQVVGTPWLAISGCPWPEYFFNDTPFYSVLPDCPSYPSEGEVGIGCGKLLSEGKTSVCMRDENLREKLPEIIKAAQMLLETQFTYHDAIELHLKKLRDSKRDMKKFFFFDGIMGIRQ